MVSNTGTEKSSTQHLTSCATHLNLSAFHAIVDRKPSFLCQTLHAPQQCLPQQHIAMQSQRSKLPAPCPAVERHPASHVAPFASLKSAFTHWRAGHTQVLAGPLAVNPVDAGKSTDAEELASLQHILRGKAWQ